MCDLKNAIFSVPGHGMDPQKALKGCRAGELQVLLAHQPNAAKRVIREGLATNVDLILSGQTFIPSLFIPCDNCTYRCVRVD